MNHPLGYQAVVDDELIGKVLYGDVIRPTANFMKIP